MIITELLSPAKDKTTAIEAIDCGADAVYIGAPNFGARKNASNSLDDIKAVCDYAHKFRVKVYVTVNTILFDDETDKALEMIKALDLAGADAIIIQDMGLLKKISDLQGTENSEYKTDLPIHISTQADNRLPEKIAFFNRTGVSRVVLARELSLEQIKAVHTENPDLELEAFVHGALCVSYSGQCYLSRYIGGRSANRGECAQPCRKKYDIITDKGEEIKKGVYALCLKDFNASRLLKKMAENGIYSFKIEGRLKDSGYVKNITAYYRRELDKFSKKASSGKSFYTFEPAPEKSFNRGFTEYFLENRGECFNFNSPKSQGEYIGEIVKVSKNSFKVKTSKTLHPQDGLVVEKSGLLINKVLQEKDLAEIFPNKHSEFKTGDKVYRNSDSFFEKELSVKVKRKIAVRVRISDKIEITDEDNYKVETALPEGEEAKDKEKAKEIFKKQFSKTGDTDFYIENFEITDVPFYPVSAINELRRKSFEKLSKIRLSSYKRDKQCKLTKTSYYKKEADYRENISNNLAKEFYEEAGVKVLEPALEIKLPERQIELMRTKHCIKYALGICKSTKTLLLRDEYGVCYPLKFDCKNCEMAVLSPA